MRLRSLLTGQGPPDISSVKSEGLSWQEGEALSEIVTAPQSLLCGSELGNVLGLPAVVEICWANSKSVAAADRLVMFAIQLADGRHLGLGSQCTCRHLDLTMAQPAANVVACRGTRLLLPQQAHPCVCQSASSRFRCARALTTHQQHNLSDSKYVVPAPSAPVLSSRSVKRRITCSAQQQQVCRAQLRI